LFPHLADVVRKTVHRNAILIVNAFEQIVCLGLVKSDLESI
jgi:hypothetical protein